MCGITGVLKVDGNAIGSVTAPIVIDLIRQTTIRGEDSCGMFGVYPNRATLWSRNPKATFTNWYEWESQIQHLKCLMTNSRAYPTQELVSKEITTTDIQPFASRRFVVTHNGIISNDREIAKKFNLTDLESETDTEVIPHALDKYIGNMSLPFQRISNFFRDEVQGSFAVVMYDMNEGTMYFVTNFMPLYYTYDQTTGLFMVYSEPEMLPRSYVDRGWMVQHGQFKPYTVNKFTLGGIQSLEFRKGNTNERKVLISFSGGNDSMVNARLYQAQGYDVELLHFTYGQRAEELELRAARVISEEWKMPLHVVDVKSLVKQISRESVLINPTFDLDPEKRLEDAQTTFSYISNRNAIFGCIAGGLAEQIGAGIAVINVNLGDSVYPDNNYTFMRAMENLFNYSLNWHTKVRFTSPLINLEKHEIIRLGLYLYGDFTNTVSCYYPRYDDKHGVINCGKCGCCLYRERAFKMVGIQDPQPYGDEPLYSHEGVLLKGSYVSISHIPIPSVSDVANTDMYRIGNTSTERIESILDRAVLFL